MIPLPLLIRIVAPSRTRAAGSTRGFGVRTERRTGAAGGQGRVEMDIAITAVDRFAASLEVRSCG